MSLKHNIIALAQTLAKVANDESFVETTLKATEMARHALSTGNTIFICGNGGSHAIALHFAEELTGRYDKDHVPLPVMALGEATHTTCVGNDYGFRHIFTRTFEAFHKPGDLLIVMSTSGNSDNILDILQCAKKMGCNTIALLGKDGGLAKHLATVPLIVPSDNNARIQEVHLHILHTLAENLVS